MNGGVYQNLSLGGLPEECWDICIMPAAATKMRGSGRVKTVFEKLTIYYL